MKTLYKNGVIVTMDPAHAQAEALVTEDGKITGIGSVIEMSQLAGVDANIVDMDGGALFPGFNETHNHLSWYAFMKAQAFLGDCTTIDDLIYTIKNHYQDTDFDMLWAYAYDDTGLKDGRTITRHDLDKVSLDKPVVVMHTSAHVGYLNSKALDYFNITPETIAPVGGFIHVDNDGIPTGRLDEHAWFNIASQNTIPDAETYKKLMKLAIEEFNTQGITGVHDAGLGLEDASQLVLNTYRDLDNAGELNIRAFISAIPEIFDTLDAKPLEKFSAKFTLGGVKLFLDGSIQVETAALKEPYLQREDWSGECIMESDMFSQLVEKYHCAGHHISIHGNGNAAIEKIIEAVESAQKKHPLPSRHMLIHCQTVSKEQLSRMRACGLIPSFFAMHIQHWGDRHVSLFLGEERAHRLNPVGEAEAIGLPFTLHVDTPVRPVQALHSIHTAVNRITSSGNHFAPELGCTPYSAVRAYTDVAAYCSRSEEVRGTLSVGKYADMVLLSKDITTCPPELIKDTSVWMPILNGKIVYKSQA